jgi:hypothetical protein
MKRHFYLIGNKRGPASNAGSAFSEFLKGYRFFIPF